MPHGLCRRIVMAQAPWPRRCGSSAEMHLGTCQGRVSSLAPSLLPQPFGSAGAHPTTKGPKMHGGGGSCVWGELAD
eukprot:6597404-Pyramimonas_sp.AAC.1